VNLTTDRIYGAYGEEGGLHAGSTISVTNNTVLNDLGKGAMVYDASNSPATVSGNQVWNIADSQVVSGSGATVSGTTHLTGEPSLDTTHPWSGASTPAPAPTPTPTPTPTPYTVFQQRSETRREKRYLRMHLRVSS